MDNYRRLFSGPRLLGRRGFMFSAAAYVLAPPRAMAATTLTFRDIWFDGDAISEKARASIGVEVEMRGYMAPPLKPSFWAVASSWMVAWPSRSWAASI